MNRALVASCPKCPLAAMSPHLGGGDAGLVLAVHIGAVHPELMEDTGERLQRQLAARIQARRN